MSFVRRRLATETVNVFKSAFKDRRRGKTENIGWETPLARIARTLTWILQRPKSQGLTPNTDGFFRVRDVVSSLASPLVVFLMRRIAQAPQSRGSRFSLDRTRRQDLPPPPYHSRLLSPENRK